ncbi:putative quinol monooxygenase [Pseudarthrobacter sp. NIBRBAC000502770]|uniref:putative quinol monooxygenase n=1 Tax=Pseudarthrobacter sp. NIBRBAC000502770 TaxID=2590785 RepID=UPI0011407829|nr:antibiotic biosynthesis monooxygenase [Pseudarthrobacter sp. NIBRBAC000502770]QDG88181.1 antibiotic biosynthesis monooxygenase [Pseudarthrobacter sp. NIBRBAC000502770]
MFSLWVTLEVTAEGREEFLAAIAENARASVRDELGCYRFDVIELGEAGSNRFAFYEVYRDKDAFENEHKQAGHYFTYRDIAARVVVPGSQVNVGGQLQNTFTWVE